VKTLESKETKAQRNETVTHNSVFAAHRLNAGPECFRGRHFLFLKPRITRMSRMIGCGRIRSTGILPVGPRRASRLPHRLINAGKICGASRVSLPRTSPIAGQAARAPKNGPDWARTSDPALIKRML
jgi:hypothetical protein